MSYCYEDYDVIIAGCGLSGAVLAERFATQQNKKVLILEKRDHIGGNCYDYIEPETGILVSKYGAHLFHTNYEDVWNYVNKFDTWKRWEHKVVGLIDGQYVSIPVNITTVNMLCNENIVNTDEMKVWLEKTQVPCENITNGEEMAKSRVGEMLYEKVFKDYTFKQWNKYPSELKPEVLARIPIRDNFDDRYFSDKYQALPEKGYTRFFEKLLNHPNITVKLNSDFNEILGDQKSLNNKIKIYTGPIDAYFRNFQNEDGKFPELEYRSINFVQEIFKDTPYFQPNSVVNYPGKDVDFTRIVEFKHFLNQQSPHTIIVKEYTTDSGEPYYPVLNDKNLELYEKYKVLAEIESQKHNIHFIGRLANYKYFNMDQAIKNALDYYDKFFN
jgi:UDP-galactopyranose mutase